MKKMFIIVLALACLLLCTGCFCQHEQWIDANCVDPKTCDNCGETEGEALGHDWAAADCVKPKTCTRCGETEGEVLPHTWTDATCILAKTCSVCGTTEGEPLGHSWLEADCDDPKTCSACGETEGEALGHSWLDATTEAPKTCDVCAATEGERIITDERFTTAAAQPLFGPWEGQLVVTARMMGLADTDDEVVYNLKLTFGNAGDLYQETAFADWESVKPLYLDYIVGSLYLQFAMEGIDGPAADAAVQETFGMSMEEYAKLVLDQMDPNAMMEVVSMVYYVEDGKLYMAISWDEEMEASEITIEGDTLTIDYGNGEILTFTRVAE